MGADRIQIPEPGDEEQTEFEPSTLFRFERVIELRVLLERIWAQSLSWLNGEESVAPARIITETRHLHTHAAWR